MVNRPSGRCVTTYLICLTILNYVLTADSRKFDEAHMLYHQPILQTLTIGNYTDDRLDNLLPGTLRPTISDDEQILLSQMRNASAFEFRYNETSNLMKLIMGFHKTYYAVDGILPPQAINYLIKEINPNIFISKNYTDFQIRQHISHITDCFTPGIMKRITKTLKKIENYYVNFLKEPRIATKGKKMVEDFKSGALFRFPNGSLTLECKDMTRDEEWEASVFDPLRLLYLEYPNFAKTSEQAKQLDDSVYYKKFEKFYETDDVNDRNDTNSTDSIETSYQPVTNLDDCPTLLVNNVNLTAQQLKDCLGEDFLKNPGGDIATVPLIPNFNDEIPEFDIFTYTLKKFNNINKESVYQPVETSYSTDDLPTNLYAPQVPLGENTHNSSDDVKPKVSKRGRQVLTLGDAIIRQQK